MTNTREEKTAKLLEELLMDIRVDLDLVGLYFYQFARKVAYNRLSELFDIIKDNTEGDKQERHQRALEDLWRDY